jgi:hypothetical protein
VELTFKGTGISWIGTNLSGAADVYIDGVQEVKGLTFQTRGKTGPQSVLFSKTGQAPGEHTLKIVSQPGRRQSQRNNGTDTEPMAEIPVDAFVVHDHILPAGNIKLVINNLWNHTKMGLGNYMKEPVYIRPGHSGKISFRLLQKEH